MTAPPSWQARRRARQSQSVVDLYIDELVLHGVAQADMATLTGAFGEELSRLAARPSAFAPMQANAVVADPYTVGAPQETGRAVAASIWAGVQRQGRGP